MASSPTGDPIERRSLPCDLSINQPTFNPGSFSLQPLHQAIICDVMQIKQNVNTANKIINQYFPAHTLSLVFFHLLDKLFQGYAKCIYTCRPFVFLYNTPQTCS